MKTSLTTTQAVTLIDTSKPTVETVVMIPLHKGEERNIIIHTDFHMRILMDFIMEDGTSFEISGPIARSIGYGLAINLAAAKRSLYVRVDEKKLAQLEKDIIDANKTSLYRR